MFSVFDKKFDLAGELKAIREEVRAINDLEAMVNTRGWVRFRSLLVDKIVSYDSMIVSLSENVKKHADEINYKHALRSTLKEVIQSVDNTFDAEVEVQKRIKILEETAKKVGLIEDNPR